MCVTVIHSFVRVFLLSGLFSLGLSVSAFSHEISHPGPLKDTSHKNSQKPITHGWESKEVTAKPITKGWDALEISSPLQQIKAKLTQSDYLAALQAMQHALSEVGDGKTYVWRSPKLLRGKIQPTNVFRDVDSRLCRHVIYTLVIETYSKTIEGVACRSLTGRWDLT